MELKHAFVETTQSLTLPDLQEVQIMPIGDVQLGAIGTDVERLKRQIDWAMSQKTPTYFLGMGDYIDTMSPSNRKAWAGAELYDSAKAAMEARVHQLTDEFLTIVDGTEGMWLGLLQGHHYYDHADATTSDQDICEELDAPFLGSCAYVVVNFPNGQRCVIWCHHGNGSGRVAHSPLTALYPIVQTFEADIYLIGHQTKKVAVKIPRIYVSEDGQSIIDRNKIVAGTGGFTKGYELGSAALSGKPEGSYVEQAMMSPVALGGVLIRVRPKEDKIDLNVEL